MPWGVVYPLREVASQKAPPRSICLPVAGVYKSSRRRGPPLPRGPGEIFEMTAVEDIASLQEIRDLLKALPPADEEAAEAALERQGRLRSEERSVGKECVRTCRFRWAPSQEKKKTRRSI